MKTNWQTKTLGEVLSLLVNGINCKQNKNKHGDRITRIETIAQAKIDFNRVGYCKLSIVEKSKYKLKQGDILFSHINSVVHVGKSAIFNSDEELYHGTNLLLMRPANFILPDYLQYFLKFLYQKKYWYTVCKQSVNQASVNQQDIKKIKISYPEFISEQHRIVKILDEVFEKTAKAKESAEKNIQNAKEILESYLQSVFTNQGNDWEEKKLNDVLQKTKTIDPTKKPKQEFIYLDVSSVNKETKKIENAALLMGKNAPSRARKLIETGDVIFATVRPTHSRVALITEEYNGQICSTGYFVLRTKEFLNNNLVFYFLLTKDFNKQMEKLQKGASYPAVTDSEVKNIIISYPKSIPEQKSIVTKLDNLSAETKKLESIYKQKLADLEELKKSVLKKAFSGEL